MKILILSVAIALAGCSQFMERSDSTERPDPPTQASFVALRAELQAALAEGSRSRLEHLLDPSFVFVHSTGKLEVRSAFVDRMVAASAAKKVPEIEFLKNDFRLYGNTLVWITQSRRRGTSIEFLGTDVLVKRSDGWKWVSVQSARIEH